ncbi:MAG: phage tail sheath C-terminal domain-containing protein [Pseudomonadota bacterium]
MNAYARPGVFYERVDASAPGISALRTDVAAFVGVAERGPVNEPVPVQSFRQFQAHFGSFIGAGYLAYAVHAFFEGGGERCWVVRVTAATGDQRARAASLWLSDTVGALTWRLVASSPGVWGDALRVQLIPQVLAQGAVSPGHGRDDRAQVSAIAGFERAALVRLRQDDGAGGVREALRVISHIDAATSQLYWVHPDPTQALPYDRPLEGFDADLPWTIQRLAWRLDVYEAGRLIQQTNALEQIPQAPRYAPDVLRKPTYPTRLADAQPLPAPAPAVVIEADAPTAIPNLLDAPAGLQRLQGGADGLAALTPTDYIGATSATDLGAPTQPSGQRGLSTLNHIDEVAVIAAPDVVIQPQPAPEYTPVVRPDPDPCRPCPPPPPALAPPNQPALPFEQPPEFTAAQIAQVQAAMVEHCEQRGDRFALLDPPASAARDDANGTAAIRAWRSRFDTSYAALYYPWVRVIEPAGDADSLRAIPPSGHVAGCIARHDLARGVHRAPANSPLPWLQGLTATVDDRLHELLNAAAINVLRQGSARGLRILGARTLSSDPLWRFINVRRLLLFLRKAIDMSTQWAVFEPNHFATRQKLIQSLSSLLTGLWQGGALAGASPQEAYFIKCDEENNPPDARANGRLHALVGVAPSQPMEFIVLRVGRQDNALYVNESTLSLTTGA